MVLACQAFFISVIESDYHFGVVADAGKTGRGALNAGGDL
jgi:hypothetical protein